MAPRLKILMASESKKVTQIYFSFLSKVPANEPPPGSPTGPLWRGRPIYGAFLHISQKPHLSVSPVKEPSLKVPFVESLAERCPTIRALLHSSIKVPGIQAPAPPPHTHTMLNDSPHKQVYSAVLVSSLLFHVGRVSLASSFVIAVHN
jgi:hypothetical protein